MHPNHLTGGTTVQTTSRFSLLKPGQFLESDYQGDKGGCHLPNAGHCSGAYMNRTRRHQRDTRNFEELTFAGQAKAINIRIVILERSVRAHLRRAAQEGRDIRQVRQKCIGQVRRLLDRLQVN